ncbi:30S ribosomal protein S9 [endosymbiont of Metamasius hemipterus]|uniref:30S ribosomal protein S9 n=1 Tax=endosymbiont of Metamasius hemipterus TaxID=204627 RepID=A0ABT0TWJ9_9GAMM|nr:30S ribosomal protein S9 [endosymbiont of Metamasius hemipterus]
MNKIYYGTGKRKTALSRIFLKSGNGREREKSEIIINKKNINEYFNNINEYINKIFNIINLFELKDKIDLFITVKGGGNTGQLNSIILGISRALYKYNNNYKEILKKINY